jgi:hypothetical protein
MGILCCFGPNGGPRVAPVGAGAGEGAPPHVAGAPHQRGAGEEKAAAAALPDDSLVALTNELDALLGDKPTQEGTKRAMWAASARSFPASFDVA